MDALVKELEIFMYIKTFNSSLIYFYFKLFKINLGNCDLYFMA